MRDFAIILDTTSDLDAEMRREYDIEFINSHLSVDGHEMDALTDWSTMDRDEFFNALRKNPSRFKTAPPSGGEMALRFEQILAEGKDIIYFSISSALSSTCDSVRQARDIVQPKYPEAKIICFDTLRFGPAIGLMAVNAALLRREGRSADEVILYFEQQKNKYHQAGWLDDLTYVAKQGRLTHSKAFLGTLIGVKPIGEFDYNGLTTVLGKAKGEKNAYEVLLSYIDQTIVDPGSQIVFVAHSNRKKQAEKYCEMIKERFHPKAIYIKEVYMASGTNIGPGLMAAYYTGVPISDGLEREREIIRKCLGE